MEGENTNPPVSLSLEVKYITIAENDSRRVVEKEVGESKSFLWKMFLHVTLCFSFFNMGFSSGLRGPSFEDLMRITTVSYGKGSAFLSVCYVGVIVGSILCGWVIDRYSKTLVMACAALCHGCTTFLIPLCSAYWAMLLMHVLQGIGYGVFLTGCFTTCGQMWAENAKYESYMHSMQLCLPVGSILAPLVVTPFLSYDPAEELRMPKMDEEHGYYSTIRHNASTKSAIPLDDQVKTATYNIANKTENMTMYVQSPYYKEQRLIIPYSISGVMYLIPVVFFLTISIYQKANISATQRVNPSVRLDKKEKERSRIFLRMYLIGVLAFFSQGTHLAFTQFFPAFLHNKMGWSKSLSSDIMSLYWGVYTFIRLGGICISFRVKSSTYLSVDITILIVSLIGMLVGTLYRLDVLIWVSMILLSAALSTTSPCLVSWIHTDILSRSGKHNSFYIVVCSLGVVLIPVIIGPLVQLDYTRFVYVLLTGSVILMVHHIWLLLFVRTRSQGNKRTHCLPLDSLPNASEIRHP